MIHPGVPILIESLEFAVDVLSFEKGDEAEDCLRLAGVGVGEDLLGVEDDLDDGLPARVPLGDPAVGGEQPDRQPRPS